MSCRALAGAFGEVVTNVLDIKTDELLNGAFDYALESSANMSVAPSSGLDFTASKPEARLL